jgi:hypothetical protein
MVQERRPNCAFGSKLSTDQMLKWTSSLQVGGLLVAQELLAMQQLKISTSTELT